MQRTNFYHFVLSLVLSVYSAFGSEPTVTSFTSKIDHPWYGEGEVWMECQVDNLPTSASIQFSKITHSGPVTIETKEYKYMVMGGLLYMMEFSIEDAGVYRCSVPGYDTYKDLTLNYEEQATIIDFPQRKIYDLDKGQDFELYCNATGVPKPKVWWERRAENEFDIKFSKEGPLLHLASVTPGDIGTYYCVADNMVGEPFRKQMSIRSVFYSPEMKCKQTNITARPILWDTVYLNCEVRAYPAATVEWQRETGEGRERIIEDKDKYTIYHNFASEDTPQGWYYEDELWVRVTGQPDAGKYIATASNKYGTKETEFTITVV